MTSQEIGEIDGSTDMLTDMLTKNDQQIERPNLLLTDMLTIAEVQKKVVAMLMKLLIELVVKGTDTD